MNKKTKKSDKGGLTFKLETVRSLTDAEIGRIAGARACQWVCSTPGSGRCPEVTFIET